MVQTALMMSRVVVHVLIATHTAAILAIHVHWCTTLSTIGIAMPTSVILALARYATCGSRATHLLRALHLSMNNS